ncbi:hypothetical protein AVEN_14914-1 [Araneus ventricosus]|uniref:Cuticle protein 16.8 n=1 Tax=Araneus ventricosus TaxID=182803 RepID=A0A4Y2JQK5_ARAVE|nr:hypothetical protein AVEN_14914-1 [Araneus ventricosus]
MQSIKVLGLVMVYTGYSVTALATSLNSEFNSEYQFNSYSSRASNAARKPAGDSSYSGSSGGFGQSKSHTGYDFDYKVADGRGNTHYHKAETDDKGTVRGTYGYEDTQGLYRVVDYMADASGFHAKIKTNEPGTNGKSPANVEVTAEQPPAVFQGNYAEPVRILQDKRIRGEADLTKYVDATGEISVCSLIHRDKVQYPSAKLASEEDGRPIPCFWRTLPVSKNDIYQSRKVGRDGQSQYEQGTGTINKGEEPLVQSEPETLSAVVNDAFRPSSHSDSIPDEDDDEEE